MAKERIVLEISIDFEAPCVYQIPITEAWAELQFDIPREYLPDKAKVRRKMRVSV